MLARTILAFAVVAFMFSFVPSVEAQTHAAQTAVHQDASQREAYLKREEAFTTRMNFTSKQKEQYSALVEKRNAALNSFKPGVKNLDASGNELTRKQVIIEFQQGLDAMLNEKQRSKMRAERAKVSMY